MRICTVYQVERKCGVYVYSMSSNHYALVSTVSDNLKLYSMHSH